MDADAAGNPGFADVAADSIHLPAINALAEAAVLDGTECGSGLFCPSQPLQRWTAAVWLVRAFDTEPASALDESRFADVEPGEWWAPHAERLAEMGITDGCRTDPLRYCPAGTMTRGRTASFLARALDLETEASAGFVDIKGSVHADSINALASAKIARGCGTEPARYCPNRPTTRAQMASLIARALGLVPLPIATGAETGQGGASAEEGSGTAAVADDAGSRDAESRDAESRDAESRDVNTGADQGDDHGDRTAPGSGYTAVSSGVEHACGLRTDQTIVCWGDATWGLTDPPAGQFSALASANTHSCGLRTDQTIVCWGDATWGLTDPPAGQFSAVTAGNGYSCGLRTDGTIACWGDSKWGKTDPPAGQWHRLLGRQQVGQDRSSRRTVQRLSLRRGAFLRAAHRRHHRLLGTRVANRLGSS